VKVSGEVVKEKANTFPLDDFAMTDIAPTVTGRRTLAIASGGGHWKQLLRLGSVLDRYDTTYVTTINGLPQEAGVSDFRIIEDCNRNDRMSVVRVAFSLLMLILTVRPHVIISTGAAPGLIAIALGRMMFVRTLWIDSIANGDELSMSGRIARRMAHQTLSQWQNVANTSRVGYWGQLL